MNAIRLTILSLVLIASCGLLAGEATLPADQKLAVILLIGQSNMAGRGKIEAQDTVPDPHVWMLDKAGEWAPARDPLHFDKPKIAGVGLGLTFGRTLCARDPKLWVGLVPAAFGGTSLDQWKKGGNLYNDALARARTALKHGTLAGILWHQGEADTSAAKADSYAERFAKFIHDLREDLAAPEVPVVVGQLGEFHAKKSPGVTHFNDLLLELPRKVSHCAAASSKDLTSIGDDTHFDAKSQREFGKRYADAYLKLAK